VQDLVLTRENYLLLVLQPVAKPLEKKPEVFPVPAARPAQMYLLEEETVQVDLMNSGRFDYSFRQIFTRLSL